MDRNEARQVIKMQVRCETYLEKSKNGLYCCPLCGSGKGSHGTGAVKYFKDTNTWFCYACNNEGLNGHRGDVIDLYGIDSGLNHNDALQELAREHGITIDPYQMTAAQAAASFDKADRADQAQGKTQMGAFSWDDVVNPPKEHEAEASADYTEYYKVCRARLGDPAAVAYLKGRGINQETAARYGLGYDPAADVANAPGATGSAFKPYPCQRIIIPTSKAHYVGRSVDPATPKAFQKMNPKKEKGAGSPGLFNKDVLYAQDAQEIFVTEGAFDALSVLQEGYAAVALNSAGNTRLILNEVTGRADQFKSKVFILCPDNDPDPEKAARVKGKFAALAQDLAALGVLSITADICAGYKDANDAMVGNKAGFKKALEDAVKKARQTAEGPANDQAAPQETGDAAQIQGAEENTVNALKEINGLVDELRISETSSERALIENQIIKVLTNGITLSKQELQQLIERIEKEMQAAENPGGLLPGLLTYSDAVEVFLTANDKYIDLTSFPAFSLTAKIKVHDSVVVAADTGAGKSSLAINFLNDLNDDYPCIYINLEMDVITVLRRLVAIQSGIEIDRIEGYKNDDQTAAAVNTALNVITNRKPLQVIQGAYYLQTIQAIIEKSTEGREDPTIVIIDHSLLVDTKEHTGSRYDRFTQVSEGLRRMALQYNIIIFVLLQQNRSGKADNEKPQNSSLKESGSWENDATHICFLWYDQAIKRKKLLLTKNRNGSSGEFLLNYWKKTQTYTEAANAAAATPATGDGTPHKQTKRERQKEKLLNAYTAAISATNGNPTLQAIAEAADVTTATVKGWIKEYGGYMVNGQTVDPAGIDATIEKDDFVKLTPADNDPFEDQEAAGAADQERPWTTNITERL